MNEPALSGERFSSVDAVGRLCVSARDHGDGTVYLVLRVQGEHWYGTLWLGTGKEYLTHANEVERDSVLTARRRVRSEA